MLVLFVPQQLSDLFARYYNFSDPGQLTVALAVFQLVYNITGAILFYPFIGTLARLIENMYKPDKTDYALGVSNLSVEDPSVS